jgi:hydroxyethylthiazole kinase-like uncharacterized protein yjeF
MMSEELLMEHAAMAMAREIASRFKGGKVLIVCGAGNNGADGLALARLLVIKKGFDVRIFVPFGTGSWLSEKQLERARALSITEVNAVEKCDILVDALLGSGLKGDLEDKARDVIAAMDAARAYKIACDIPSGVNKDGAFEACPKMDLTITMGAPKIALFNDRVKDRAGRVSIADLGIPREAYAGETDSFLLEMSDLKLPLRKVQDSHKGSYGHLAVALGDKPGAAILSALAALRFGAGLTTIVTREKRLNLPLDLLQSPKPVEGTNAIAIGMGLGDTFLDEELLEMIGEKACVIDADALSRAFVPQLLKADRNVVLTPHPKEFAALLSHCSLGEYTIANVQENRLQLSLKFSLAFPNATLVLKGANVIIARSGLRFINTLGSPVLAKGGSGDVLAGMIGSLLAQGYTSLDAAIHANLAHTLAARRYNGADYSMLPTDLINSLGALADQAANSGECFLAITE